jgi:hypothetical protein
MDVMSSSYHRASGPGHVYNNIALLLNVGHICHIYLLMALHVEHVPHLPGTTWDVLWDGSSHFVEFIFVGFLVYL